MSDSEYFEPLPWETRNLGIESFAVSGAIHAGLFAIAVMVVVRRLAEIADAFGSGPIPEFHASVIEQANDPFAVLTEPGNGPGGVLLAERKLEADEFYSTVHPAKATDEEKMIQRQALSGLLSPDRFS